jgi:hypothetical protein
VLLSVAHLVTASALIKTILCLIIGVKGGAKSGVKCGVKKVIFNKVGGRARGHCCEVLRRPPPLPIK